MEERKLNHEEIADIVLASTDTVAKKLQDSSVIIPKLVKAVIEFYSLLVNAGRVEVDETKSRDVIAEMFVRDMKKRADSK